MASLNDYLKNVERREIVLTKFLDTTEQSEFRKYKNNNIKIGIITVTENAAQQVCDLMLKNNIKAIWNFTPKKLNVPKDVLVQQENLALSLAHLNNQLVNRN